MVLITRAPNDVRVGVVLAGGESRRMGYDKRDLRIDGETLVQRNLAFLHSIFPLVGLSVRSSNQVPADLPGGVVVIPDEVPGSPMGGLTAVLAHFIEPVFVLAADLIAPEREAVDRVLAEYRDVDVAVPMAVDHLEPLHAVYGPRCLPHMRQLLAAGAHSILDLFPLVRVARVPFADTTPFFNVNTPADWAEAQRRLGGDASARAGGEPTVRDRTPPRAAQGGGSTGRPALLGIVGRTNSGKTTLIERLIPELTRRGLRIGTVKRVAHFDIDVPGKDSWRHAAAGAAAYAVASAAKFAFVTRYDVEASLEEIVERYFTGYDLVICEGYRREAPQVVEIFRTDAGHEAPICEPTESLAIVTDAELVHEHRFGLDDVAQLARFLISRLGLTTMS